MDEAVRMARSDVRPAMQSGCDLISVISMMAGAGRCLGTPEDGQGAKAPGSTRSAGRGTRAVTTNDNR